LALIHASLRAMRVALELLFSELPPRFRIGRHQFSVGQLAQGFD